MRELKAYTIRQLRKSAREYAISEHQYVACYDYWYESDLEYYAEQMAAEGIDVNKRQSRVRKNRETGKEETVYYDEPQIHWDNYFNVSLNVRSIDPSMMNIPEYTAWLTICAMRNIDNNVSYTHDGRDVEHDFWRMDDLTEEEVDTYVMLHDTICEIIKGKIDDWEGRIGKELESVYEYQYSDEAIIDHLEANDYKFNYKGEEL